MPRDLKFSTGFRDGLLATGSFKDVVAGCVLKVYGNDGAVPADANAAKGSATLLCVYTGAGDGTTPLGWEAAAVAGVLPKSSSQAWEGEGIATGVPAFFRYETLADAGDASTTAPRIQGLCGTVNSDLNMNPLSITDGATNRVDYGNVAMPAQ